MSINGHFRQVSPRALDVLLARPELMGGARDWMAEQPDAADPFAGLPASARAILGSLPAQVAEVADAMQALGEEGALARYVPAEFEAAGITPCGWDDPAEDEQRREWLRETFREVLDYYVAARDRGYGMILTLV